MATIFVEGLGDVQIQGNIPNAEEQEAIAKALGQETQQTTNVVEEQQDLNFLQSVGKGLTDRSTSLAAGGLTGFATGATPNNQQYGFGNTFNQNFDRSMTSANPFFDELTNQGLI